MGTYLWFTDGYLLPYTGQSKVHYAYNTQRQKPEPGRTNQVTCNEQGRIVDFVLEEGKGDMKSRVLEVTDKWEKELPVVLVSVFDREGYGAPNFSRLVKAGKPFVTWEKNVNAAQMASLDDELFTVQFTFNDRRYAVFERPRTYTYTQDPEEDGQQAVAHTFELRELLALSNIQHCFTLALTRSLVGTDTDPSKIPVAPLPFEFGGNTIHGSSTNPGTEHHYLDWVEISVCD